LDRGFVPVCCDFLAAGPALAGDALRCLAAVAALGYDSAISCALAAIAESGIVSTGQDRADLLRLSAEFSTRCILRPALAGAVLSSGILELFCEAAQGGSFEARVSAFSVFDAAVGSDEYLRVVAECGGGQAVVDSLDAGEQELLPLLLRLLAAAPGLRSAAREAGVERAVAELAGGGDPEVADLAEVVLRLLDSE
jgi:hypothetical protein